MKGCKESAITLQVPSISPEELQFRRGGSKKFLFLGMEKLCAV
jgi:hypothetical protein